MSANHRVVLAVIEADRSPDWAAGEAFVDAYVFEQLEELLDSPATLSFHEFGAGLERVRQELREDVALLRVALASGHDDLATFTTHGLTVYASYEDTPAGDLFLALSRLRWSGALAALGFDLPAEVG